jgi:viroplasmin and RNaseH domain-containing protein
MSKKFYTVWVGRTPGVFDSWAETEKSIKGYPDAKFKSFKTHDLALSASTEGYEKHIGNKPQPEIQPGVVNTATVKAVKYQVHEQEPGHELVYTDGVDQHGLSADDKPF